MRPEVNTDFEKLFRFQDGFIVIAFEIVARPYCTYIYETAYYRMDQVKFVEDKL